MAEPFGDDLERHAVPIEVVSARLGHTSIAMTMDVYAHLLPGQDADAVAALDRLLWGDQSAPHGRTPGAGHGRGGGMTDTPGTPTLAAWLAAWTER